MPKRSSQKHHAPQPTDQLRGSEVSSILGIHRNTLQRMVALKTLEHDGETGVVGGIGLGPLLMLTASEL